MQNLSSAIENPEILDNKLADNVFMVRQLVRLMSHHGYPFVPLGQG